MSMQYTKIILCLLAVAVWTGFSIQAPQWGPVSVAHADDDDDSDGLVGTWRFSGNDPAMGPFFDYLVFHEGHTLTERVSLSSFSMGSGVWEEIDSDSDSDSDSANFAATFESFADTDFDGSYDARARVRITFELEDDTLAGTGTIELRTLDNSQTLVIFEGSTFSASRMTVIRQ